MMDALSRRRGRFSLPMAIIDSRPATAMSILDSCIPINSSRDMEDEVVDFEAVSAVFDEVDDGAPAPYYSAIIDGTCIRGWLKISETAD